MTGLLQRLIMTVSLQNGCMQLFLQLFVTKHGEKHDKMMTLSLQPKNIGLNIDESVFVSN